VGISVAGYILSLLGYVPWLVWYAVQLIACVLWYSVQLIACVVWYALQMIACAVWYAVQMIACVVWYAVQVVAYVTWHLFASVWWLVVYLTPFGQDLLSRQPFPFVFWLHSLAWEYLLHFLHVMSYFDAFNEH